MIEKKLGIMMNQKLKKKMAKATGNNYKLNRKVMQLKSSWDEVEGMINGTAKKKKH